MVSYISSFNSEVEEILTITPFNVQKELFIKKGLTEISQNSDVGLSPVHNVIIRDNLVPVSEVKLTNEYALMKAFASETLHDELGITLTAPSVNIVAGSLNINAGDVSIISPSVDINSEPPAEPEEESGGESE
jgi:hypothetical protein